MLWQTISAGKEWSGEFHNKKKNGELYWENASISPIRDLAGRVTHYVAVKEDITARKQTEAERDTLIKDLQEALANVKSLSGLLPICASCKKIRDDKGYWSQVESYIQSHSDALHPRHMPGLHQEVLPGPGGRRPWRFIQGDNMTLIRHPKLPAGSRVIRSQDGCRYAGVGRHTFRLASRKTAYKLLHKTLEVTL